MRSRTTLRASSDSPCCSKSKTLRHDSVRPPRPELYAIPLTKSELEKREFQIFFSTSRGCAGRNMRFRTTLRASSDSPCCSESKTLKHDSVQHPRPELYAIPLTKSDEKREFQIFVYMTLPLEVVFLAFGKVV